MAIDFKSTWVVFPRVRSAVKQTLPGHVTFDSTVRKANAALKGFKMWVISGDHNFYHQEVDIDSIQIDGRTVNFNVDLMIVCGRNERFEGTVEVLVIADRD